MARIFKKSGNWFLDYRYPPGRAGKRVRKMVGPLKEEAEIKLGEVQRMIRQGEDPLLREIKPMLFGKMADEFLAKHASRARDRKSFDEMIKVLRGKGKRHTNLPHFGTLTLQAMTPRVIDDFIAARRDVGMSGATANRYRAVLSKLFNCAIDWGYFGRENPVKKVKRFAESPGRVRFLTGDEADALIAGAPNKDHRHVLIAALHTGGRRREILTLRPEDVDLERRVLYFDQTNTKSGKQREVPIDDALLAVLRERLKVRRIDKPASEFVFTWRGRPIKDIRTAFETAREEAGLGKDVTFHTLRHTFASWFMINGGDLYRLQKFMGHSTIALTQRYAHLSKDYLREGVRFFGAPAAVGGHSVDTEAPPMASSPPASS